MISKFKFRNYEQLKAVEEEDSAIHTHLTQNNSAVKRNILEHLLNLQRLVITFENDSKLQSVDKEMWQIHETKYQSQINDLELEIQQLHKNYTEAQNEVIKLNASNCSYKIEVNHLKEEIERMKEMTTIRSEVSSPYTTTLSTNLQSLDKVAFMTVGASSQMFKNRSKYVFIF